MSSDRRNRRHRCAHDCQRVGRHLGRAVQVDLGEEREIVAWIGADSLHANRGGHNDYVRVSNRKGSRVCTRVYAQTILPLNGSIVAMAARLSTAKTALTE